VSDIGTKIQSKFKEPVNSSRFVQVDGMWYFATRETNTCGPYQSYTGALEGLHMHLSNIDNDNGNSTIPSTLEIEELDPKNVVFWRK